MRKFRVFFNVFREGRIIEKKILVVESGNKKLATFRAMREINKDPKYVDLYKTVDRVEEIVE